MYEILVENRTVREKKLKIVNRSNDLECIWEESETVSKSSSQGWSGNQKKKIPNINMKNQYEDIFIKCKPICT